MKILVTIAVVVFLAVVPLWPTSFKIFSYTRQDDSVGYGVMRRDAAIGKWDEFVWGASSEEEALGWAKQQCRFAPATAVLYRCIYGVPFRTYAEVKA